MNCVSSSPTFTHIKNILFQKSLIEIIRLSALFLGLFGEGWGVVFYFVLFSFKLLLLKQQEYGRQILNPSISFFFFFPHPHSPVRPVIFRAFWMSSKSRAQAVGLGTRSAWALSCSHPSTGSAACP